MNLYNLSPGQKGIIVKIKGSGSFRKRLIEMGFVSGREVNVVKKAPLQDPIEYQILEYSVSLRKAESEMIEIVDFNADKEFALSEETTKSNKLEEVFHPAKEKNGENIINIALVGNPNSGKTTLFNYISGSRQMVGNYPGVTVDAKKTKFKYKNYSINIVDLPGTYSVSAYTPEEKFVRQFVNSENTDIVINVVDSSNLERNLYLTTQMLDMDITMVIALNMFDELKKKGDEFNYEALSEMIGVPTVPTISKTGEGLQHLLEKVIDVYENKEPTVRHIHINYGVAIEDSIEKIEDEVDSSGVFPKHLHARYIALKLFEKDPEFIAYVSKRQDLGKLTKVAFGEIERIEKLYNADTSDVIADHRYGFIEGALKETYKKNAEVNKKETVTKKIDKVLTHKIWGLPIFLIVLFLMFFSTFHVGGLFMNIIEAGVRFIGSVADMIIPSGIIQALISEGIIGGVGGVIVFLPNIIILFLFISFLEGSGYMSRIAFIMDRLMHKIGLHGKSFIPLIMGFGCNVPAIMATRTLENKSDRILTMLIIPLMSCSARLPVYILLISTFFPKNPALVLFAIYWLGIMFAAVFAIIFKKLFFNKTEAPFVMELPPYRMPTLKATYTYMWLRASQYLKKMGGIILIASVIIWVLGYFPQNIKFSKDYALMFNELSEEYEQKKVNTSSDIEPRIAKQTYILEVNNLVNEREQERHSKTYIGMMGKMIEPIMKPLGLDWRLSISLLSGFPAKEVIVSTMGVLFQDYVIDEKTLDFDNPSIKYISLDKRIKTSTITEGINKGDPLFNSVSAFAYLIFVLFYFPCTASVVAIHKESGRWVWSALSILYTTIFAWLMAFGVYQIGSMLF